MISLAQHGAEILWQMRDTLIIDPQYQRAVRFLPDYSAEPSPYISPALQPHRPALDHRYEATAVMCESMAPSPEGNMLVHCLGSFNNYFCHLSPEDGGLRHVMLDGKESQVVTRGSREKFKGSMHRVSWQPQLTPWAFGLCLDEPHR